MDLKKINFYPESVLPKDLLKNDIHDERIIIKLLISKKKQLIIIISLLISSPAFGESKTSKTLYEWETASGIQWREIGHKDSHAKYKGDVMIGRPHGVGTLVYPDGNKYVGEWMNGLFHGQGIYTIASNGYSYVASTGLVPCGMEQ